MKIDSKFIYDLLSVSSSFPFLKLFKSYSLLTVTISNRSKGSASTSSLSTSQLTLSARSSNTQTTLIAKDSRRHASCSLKRTTKRLSPQEASKSSTRKRCYKSSESARRRRDRVADSKTDSLKGVSTSKEVDDEDFANNQITK